MNRRLTTFAITACACALVLTAEHAAAQTTAPTSGALDIGVSIPIEQIGELDSHDTGIGVRAGWALSRMFTVEGELGFYPSDIPSTTPVTSSRTEGLFGVTAGPTLARWRPFARVRPGFLRVASAPAPLACILIFPPPLSCSLAGGQTLFALDFGGGLEVLTPARTYVRVDVGDRMLKYPGPALDRGGATHDGDFYKHDLRVAFGAGWRF